MSPLGVCHQKQHPLLILRTICTLLGNNTGTPLFSSVLFNWEGYKVHHLSIWTLFLSMSHKVSSAGCSQKFVIKKTTLLPDTHTVCAQEEVFFLPWDYLGQSAWFEKLNWKYVYHSCGGELVAGSGSACLWLWTHCSGSLIYNLLSIHALFVYKYSVWQIWFPLPPIPVMHFLQLYGVGPLWEAWYHPPAAQSTCLEFTSKIHLKHTIFSPGE